MYAKVLKKILSFAEVSAVLYDGDMIKIVIKIGGRVVLDKTIDFIRGA